MEAPQEHYDYIICGAGPIGLSLAAYLVKNGERKSIAIVSPSFSPSKNTLCAFEDEIINSLYWIETLRPINDTRSLFKQRWARTSARFHSTLSSDIPAGACDKLSTTEIEMTRAYLKLDLEVLFDWCMAAIGSTGDDKTGNTVTKLQGKVTNMDGVHSEVTYRCCGDGNHDAVTGGREVTIGGKQIIDTTGPRHRPNDDNIKWQRFYGCKIRLLNVDGSGKSRSINTPLDKAVLCDFTHVFSDGYNQTQCYILPASDSEVFIQEFNIMLGADTVPWDIMEKRLKARLSKYEPYEMVFVERNQLPLVTSYKIPDPSHRVIGFGAAGGMIHSTSGYMIAYALDRVPILAKGLLGSKTAYDIYHDLWTVRDVGNFVLFQAATRYLEFIGTQKNEVFEAYFKHFFLLPVSTWTKLWARTGCYAGNPLQVLFAALALITRLPVHQTVGMLKSVVTSLVCDDVYSRVNEWTGDKPVTEGDIQSHCLKYAGGSNFWGAYYAVSSLCIQLSCYLSLSWISEILLGGSSILVKILLMMVWYFVRSGVTIRFTALFHDCLHGSFMASPFYNKAVGFLIGFLIGVSPELFTKDHLSHHRDLGKINDPETHSGNRGHSEGGNDKLKEGGKDDVPEEVDNRNDDAADDDNHSHSSPARGSAEYSAPYNLTESIYWTKQTYDNASTTKKYMYRLLRDPLLFFTVIGPLGVVFYNYVIMGFSIHSYFGVGAMLTVAYYQAGWVGVALELSSLYVAAMSPLMLSHVMHVCNPGFMARSQQALDFNIKVRSSIEGTTFMRMPWALRWISLGLEEHVVHHVCSRVPLYRLSQCRREAPLGMWDQCAWLSFSNGTLNTLLNTFWDEEKKEYVPFDSHVALQKKLSTPLLCSQVGNLHRY